MKMKSAVLVAALFACATAHAHVGSRDVFYEGQAGPYRLFVSVAPPEVIPGVANIVVRAADSDVKSVQLVPLPVAGEAAERPPTPDTARRSTEDPQLFTGALWLMEAGSWQVRVSVDGARGPATLSVPVPALPLRTRGMQNALGVLLAALLLLLCAGAVSIAASAAREATLEPGQAPGPVEQRRARITFAVAAILVAAALFFGARWWGSEADEYSRYAYKPLQLRASVEDSRLVLDLSDPGWLDRRLDDWVPDHDHLMHLFVVREPALDRVWHLHPTATDPGRFVQMLPAMPAGRYRLFGDLVHRSGLAETVVTSLEIPEITGLPLSGDDSAGSAPTEVDHSRRGVPLAEGAYLTFVNDGGTLVAGRPLKLHFRAISAGGQPTGDLEPYMGMLGHAAIVARDLSVFAHVHPTGSVAMASLAAIDPHAMHHHDLPAGPSDVSFPWGFPKAGEYRVFVQIKRLGHVETAAFDFIVKAADK
jgi:hypothetical protein